MSYGFRVLSDSGKISAGSDLSNLFFQNKGLVYIPKSGVVEPQHSEQSVIFYISPLPMVRKGGMIFLASMGTYNGDWWYNQDYGEGVVEYFIFSPPVPENTQPYGISVFDANGRPTFNNSSRALKIVTVANTYGEATQQAGGLTIYKPYSESFGLIGYPGRLAFALGGTRVYWTSQRFVDPPSGSFFTDTFRDVRGLHLDSNNNLNSSTVRTGFQRYSGLQNNFNYSPNGDMPLSLIVADVAGL